MEKQRFGEEELLEGIFSLARGLLWLRQWSIKEDYRGKTTNHGNINSKTIYYSSQHQKFVLSDPLVCP